MKFTMCLRQVALEDFIDKIFLGFLGYARGHKKMSEIFIFFDQIGKKSYLLFEIGQIFSCSARFRPERMHIHELYPLQPR